MELYVNFLLWVLISPVIFLVSQDRTFVLSQCYQDHSENQELCDCLYNGTGGYLVFSDSPFTNLANTDIVAKAEYESKFVKKNSETVCLLQNKKLFCPFIIKETAVSSWKNVTVNIKFNNDSSSLLIAFWIDNPIKNCQCDGLIPSLSVKQVNWNTLEVTSLKNDHMFDFMYSYYYTVSGRRSSGGSGSLKSIFQIEHLKPKRFKDPVTVCLKTHSMSRCSPEILDTCKNTTMSAYFYFRHFAFASKSPQKKCKVTEEGVQLEWATNNRNDMKDLGFYFQLQIFDEDDNLLQTTTANDTHFKHTISDDLRRNIHYTQVRLCLSSNTCSEKLTLICEKPAQSFIYLVYVFTGLTSIVCGVLIYHYCVAQSWLQKSPKSDTRTEPVDDRYITMQDCSYENMNIKKHDDKEIYDKLDLERDK